MNLLAIILAALLGRPAVLPREEKQYTVIEEMTEPTPAQKAQWAREDAAYKKEKEEEMRFWTGG